MAMKGSSPNHSSNMNPLTQFKKIPILPLLIALALVAWTAGAAGAAISDFNADGHPDYVLLRQNAKTPQTAIWYLNNNVFISGASGPTLPSWWFLVGVADFNRDGHPDYVLLDTGGGSQSAIWYLSGRTLVGSANGPSVPPRVPGGWGLVGVGDFNGDGYPDYVLQNANTRQTAIWYLNNNVFISGVYGPTLPNGWALVGVADFNRDGHPDYVLENGTRQTAIWYLSGRTLIGGAYGPTLPGGRWSLAGTADFNGDGNPDYVLYNDNTRQTAIWYLNNNVYVGSAWGPTLPAGWSLFPDLCNPWDYGCQ